nr:MAG TPA: hypothetical protein [Caudoviricetes sp.]
MKALRSKSRGKYPVDHLSGSQLYRTASPIFGSHSNQPSYGCAGTRIYTLYMAAGCRFATTRGAGTTNWTETSGNGRKRKGRNSAERDGMERDGTEHSGTGTG